jgi:catechol 2,3-dioxygenase-like lactoylglutathione lyase family enzyme
MVVTRILAIMPVLKVADLGRSIAWYTEVLGFHAGERMAGDGDGEHCSYHTSSVSDHATAGATAPEGGALSACPGLNLLEQVGRGGMVLASGLLRLSGTTSSRAGC